MTDRAGSRQRRDRRLLIVVSLVAVVVLSTAGVVLHGRATDPYGVAVLDRPQRAADRAEPTPSILGLMEQGLDKTAGVHLSDVRLLSDDPENPVTLVPIRPTAGHHPRTKVAGRFAKLCLFYGSPFGFETCGDAKELRSGSIAASGSSSVGDPPAPAPAHFYGLVPNGVARVTVTFSGRVRDVSAPVVNNYYEAVSADPEAENRVGDIEWFDGGGHPVLQRRD